VHVLTLPMRALVVLLITLPFAGRPAFAELRSKTLTAVAGSKKLVGSHSHFSLQTCGLMSIPRVTVTRRPSKGDVSLVREAFVMTDADSNKGKVCLGRSVKGVAIYYTSRQDASGPDAFTYLVQYPSSCANCTEKEITATISIAEPNRPSSGPSSGASTVDGSASHVASRAQHVASRAEDERATSKDDAEAEGANRAAAEERESSETKPLLMPTLPPNGAVDDASCFLHGTDDDKRPYILTQSLSACSKVISSGAVTGTHLAFYYLGRAYWKYQSKDLDGALDDYNLALNLDPNHVEGYDYRADVWKAKGQIDRAIGDYAMAIRLDPKYGAAYYSRGRIYEREGSLDMARADYNSALGVRENDRLAKWAQDQARERLSELDK
jgi:hypothetical protein